MLLLVAVVVVVVVVAPGVEYPLMLLGVMDPYFTTKTFHGERERARERASKQKERRGEEPSQQQQTNKQQQTPPNPQRRSVFFCLFVVDRCDCRSHYYLQRLPGGTTVRDSNRIKVAFLSPLVQSNFNFNDTSLRLSLRLGLRE